MKMNSSLHKRPLQGLLHIEKNYMAFIKVYFIKYFYKYKYIVLLKVPQLVFYK